jgi:hypothetical protein
MQGLMTFPTCAHAIRAGYEVYDDLRDGTFLVRIRTARGWAQALALAA